MESQYHDRDADAYRINNMNIDIDPPRLRRKPSPAMLRSHSDDGASSPLGRSSPPKDYSTMGILLSPTARSSGQRAHSPPDLAPVRRHSSRDNPRPPMRQQISRPEGLWRGSSLRVLPSEDVMRTTTAAGWANTHLPPVEEAQRISAVGNGTNSTWVRHGKELERAATSYHQEPMGPSVDDGDLLRSRLKKKDSEHRRSRSTGRARETSYIPPPENTILYDNSRHRDNADEDYYRLFRGDRRENGDREPPREFVPTTRPPEQTRKNTRELHKLKLKTDGFNDSSTTATASKSGLFLAVESRSVPPSLYQFDNSSEPMNKVDSTHLALSSIKEDLKSKEAHDVHPNETSDVPQTAVSMSRSIVPEDWRFRVTQDEGPRRTPPPSRISSKLHSVSKTLANSPEERRPSASREYSEVIVQDGGPVERIHPEMLSSRPLRSVPDIKRTTYYDSSEGQTAFTVDTRTQPETITYSRPQNQLDGYSQSNRPSASITPSSSTLPFRSRVSSTHSAGILGDKCYRYSELAGDEFRLVNILPQNLSSRVSGIRCEIILANLNHPPSYIALSYTWGDPTDTKEIQLESFSVPVTLSLYGALEALRLTSEPILVWADALCIDQQNLNERTHQVQLMTSIYSKAESVAIWLGPKTDDSLAAIDFLCEVANHAHRSEKISALIASRVGERDFAAVVSLFERDYWRRLWVVQEVFNAKSLNVYCGTTRVPWSVYKLASRTFGSRRGDLDFYFSGGAKDKKRHSVSQNQLTYSQVLAHQGPGSLSGLQANMRRPEGPLLGVLRHCRGKLAADPRDKVFGILGILPEDVRRDFPIDYSLPVKEVYTDVVEYVVAKTGRLDVICEAIYFPLHTSSSNLPTWVPDWSHIVQTTALGLSFNFNASGSTVADCRFLDTRRNKLEISAVFIDTIHRHGIAVGTLCTLADYLMAFLHWRALLLSSCEINASNSIQEDFCRTICLGSVPNKPTKWQQNWLQVVYHLFASLLQSRLPQLPLDPELQSYASVDVGFDVGINPDSRRRLLQEHVGDRMMGRCFCITKEARLGMGSGFMAPGDVVVVPLGCYTPIILRPQGSTGEYRFVGDVYIHGYMHGQAMDRCREGKMEVRKFIMH
jgi:hypothetical protein